ncbi:sensor histidine kinase [Alteromonas gilva]|uniref:histidine kinase n=1 Tax=Alteromonas gilva TaxID=2987522 RepID=A0ABT5L7I0_9ALTE|nr:ATP-binding protein [Alteromonas gilva]MDC8832374.1 ATP-binding protein [Alteromonas gilva]
MRLSLRTKTIAGTSLIEATLLLILIITSLSFINALIEDTVVKRAQTTANLFVATTKNALLSLDLAALETSVQELMTNPDIVYAKVIDSQNRVLAQAGEDSVLNQLFVGDTAVSVVDDSVYDTNRAITVAGQQYGEIQIGINIKAVQSSVLTIRNWIISLALLELVLVAVFSFGLGTYLTSQLKALRKGAKDMLQAIPEKNYRDIIIPIKGNDELAELARSFNTLVNTLASESDSRDRAETQLKALNASLEKKIAERTQALLDKNIELEQSNKDRKEAQQQLFQAEKMASVGQLAAGVAHEINNPVGFVSSNLNTLEDYLPLIQLLMTLAKQLDASESDDMLRKRVDELQRFYTQHDMDFISADVAPLIEESREGLKRVSEIVKGLKVFSRVDSDELQWYDLNHCLTTTLTMVNNKLKYICKVETHFAELPNMYFNLGKITQVFTNLLINAGQAIEETGQQGVIKIKTELVGDAAKVTIADTGCGITDTNLEKLFNPFFTTKPEGQGTGLGLSISYGIIEEHGGNIEVQSTPGEGSVFTVTLPLCGKAED